MRRNDRIPISKRYQETLKQLGVVVKSLVEIAGDAQEQQVTPEQLDMLRGIALQVHECYNGISSVERDIKKIGKVDASKRLHMSRQAKSYVRYAQREYSAYKARKMGVR